MNPAAKRLLTVMAFVSGLTLAGCGAPPKKEPKDEDVKLDRPGEKDHDAKTADAKAAREKDPDAKHPDRPRRRPTDPDHAEVKPAVTVPEDPAVRLAHLRKHLDVVDERRRAIDEFVRGRNSKDLLPALVDIQERLSQIQTIPSGNATFDARVGEMLREVFGMVSSAKAGDWTRVEERAESVHAYGSACNKLLTDSIAQVKTEGDPARP